MVRKGLISLTCVLFAISVQYLPAQEKVIQPFFELSLPNNFPNKFINFLIRDQNGLLWMGTDNGLCRYISDKEVKVYNTQNTPGLLSNTIVYLLSDSQGNLWIGTRQGGVTRYSPKSNLWTNYKHNPLDANSLSDDDVLSLVEDRKGRIWIGTEKGVNVYLPERDTLIQFTHTPGDPSSISANAILYIYEDHTGRIWLGTWGGGLSLLIPNEEAFSQSYFKRISLINRDGNQESIWRIFQDSEERYWIGTHFSGLYLMQLPKDASTGSGKFAWEPRFHNYSHSADDPTTLSSNIHISAIVQDSTDNLWIGTSYGLSKITKDQLPDPVPYNSITEEKPAIEFQQYYHDPFNIKSISSNKISTLLVDQQDLVWVGTDQGVTQFNQYARQLTPYQISSESYRDIIIEEIFIPEKDHAILANTSGEVLQYDLNRKKIGPIHEAYPFIEPISDALHFRGSNKGLLYITRRSGISKIDFHQKTSTQLPIPLPILDLLKEFRLKSVHISSPSTPEEEIWIGSENGLFLIYDQGKRYKIFQRGEAMNSISDNSITGLAGDSTGRIWVTTYKGLNVVEKSGDSIYFQRFLHNPEDSLSIPYNRLLSIICLTDRLFLGTDKGLMEYHFSHKKFFLIGKDQAAHAIISLVPFKDSTIWAATVEKVLNYHIPSKQLYHYGDMEITYGEGSIYADPFDRIFIGGVRGFIGFEPKKIIKNEQAPVVTITEVHTMNPTKDESIEIMQKDSISLSHDNYQLSISFSSSNFNQAEDNHFAYRMLGFDEDWVYTASNQPIVYTNLKHGSYQFQVKGRNNDGVWSKKPNILYIEVKPAFWERPIFFVIVGLAGMALIYLFTNFYTKNVRNQNQKLLEEIGKRKEIEQKLMLTNSELEKSNQELEQFAFIASHDLKEPLQSIDSFSSLLRRQEFQERLGEKGAKYVDFISQSSIRMKEIINSLLTYSTTRQVDLDVQLCNFHELAQDCISDLSDFISVKNAHVEVGYLPSGYCDPVQIRMVLSNLIMNGIKFNTQPIPTIKIWSEKAPSGEIRFAVKDNGIGIEEEFHKKIFGIFKRLHHRDQFPGTGIGLALCYKIIERHKGKIWIDSQHGKGSTFWFELGSLSNSPPVEEHSMEPTAVG